MTKKPRYYIYLLTDPGGGRVNYMTSEETFDKLADKHESVVMHAVKRGFKQVKEGTTTAPTATPEATKEIHCSDCGNKMELRQGEKNGKQWKGYFCSEKGHKAQWV